jgi:hypothetical protein
MVREENTSVFTTEAKLVPYTILHVTIIFTEMINYGSGFHMCSWNLEVNMSIAGHFPMRELESQIAP